MSDPGTYKFQIRTHYACMPQDFGQRQCNIGCQNAPWWRSLQTHTNYLWQPQHQRMSQHRRLSFDSAHAPPQHTNGIYHRRVAVGAYQCVRISLYDISSPAHGNDRRQSLKIDLVEDSIAGRNDKDVIKGFVAPLQEFESFRVSLALNVHIECKGGRIPPMFDIQ